MASGATSGKPGGSSLGSARPRTGVPRKDARTEARNGRQPALTAGKGAGNSKRYGFTARPKQETKKRG
jgi:hypothetical protein